jgi:two-component system, cell cycle sensor histidine kinase and response regulator CckA
MKVHTQEWPWEADALLGAMASTLPLPRSVPVWVRALLIIQAASAALYAVLLVGGAEWVGLSLDPDSWWPLGVIGLAGGIACVARAATRRGERLVWALIAGGVLSWAGGFLAWTALYENDVSPPYPSVADALWIPFLVALLVALLLLLRAERMRITASAWLDALIPAFAASAVVTQVLQPHVTTGGKPLAERLTLLAYPSLDILLIALTILMLSLRGWQPGARWGLLSLAVLGSALGDLLWSYLVAAGRHEIGAAADLPYLLTAVATGWAAWAPPAPAVSPNEDRVAVALPAVAAGCAIGLLLFGVVSGELVPMALVLAVASVSAGVIRWLLALRREAQAIALRGVAAELARKADQQAAVADLGRRAIATADIDELMARATGVVANLLEAERVAVLELAPPGDELCVRADSAGLQDAPDLEPLGLAALDSGPPAVVRGNALCARIERKDGCWGVLAVVHSGAQEFGNDDVSFVQAVANVLGAVVARAREEQLEAQLQQARRLESVGKLAGGIAHDFNNLLAIIQGYADFAREAATDDAQRQDLEELSKAAGRGADLVRQLLLFSRRKAVDAVPVDLAEVVRDTEPMLRRTIGEHIELRCKLRSELPPTMIDPGQLTQVLVNLAVNARDAMPDGGTLTIEGTSAGRRVRLVVEDTGIGMSEDTRAKAFDPFFTTKPTGSGTGLGLATVYGIVTQAGGTISVDSTPGAGTRVAIELPCCEPSAPTRPAEEAPTPDPSLGETVLVVEDDDQVRGIASRILQAHGYRVLEAPGGHAALELAEREPRDIDLLLSDIVMPGMSGTELADQLRLARPGVRVLHMSGYTSGMEGPGGRAKLPDLLEKPFTASELVTRVRALLGEPELSASAR